MADQAPFAFVPGDNWFTQDQDQVAAQAAREAAAVRLRNATVRPRAVVHDPAKYAFMPESTMVDDQRNPTVGQWLTANIPGPSLKELRALIEHPMTPWDQVEHLYYPQDASAYGSSLAADAGANNIPGSLSPIRGR